MSVKDMLLALCVVVAWGVNFVVIKLGLQGMPPFLLAGLRFTLVAFPAIFFVRRPPIPLRWLVVYGMTISFGQFAFLFLAIKLGMPAGLASLVLQAQAFFTLLLGALLLAERLRWNHIVGIIIATLGMFLLATAGMEGQTSAGITLTTMMLTLSAALSWGLGNITNKIIMRNRSVPIMSLVVWSALVPIVPFFACSLLFDGQAAIVYSLLHIGLQTVLALFYLAFVATIVGYAIWGNLLSRYETWRVAPLSLLVPVVGIITAALVLDEHLSGQQMLGAVVIILGLLVNVFGGVLGQRLAMRTQS
ncbi:O-acetylserine/cysteine efflux transporter [Pantoea agglomerans]|jgi:O-acetylserine/cysteine efflux transporter|uniref:EamA family transporter n=2 Tax=Enterobacter agglomerans TaxID=549 RepID=A0A7X2MKV5_ENTAG|nr:MULTISPECIES: EamA family transporter [Pantoea]KAF6631075.1 EamA family transporter [Pantoea sp. EKM10T]MBA8866455.1 O-acetylserine/cysteine efflux transporter [Pantoea agglomerans]MBA8893635.1 O-acetylserine/cysteine efflux transporter [Pantoea agglomerans]MBD8127439.1 EamA family transporter [Pantoea agglomerans]MBD8155486.1 EamA family transporter [Pantoea agglomerans]